MKPITTVLEASKLPIGKMRVVQDEYDSHVKFVTCEVTFNKTERKKHPQLPLSLSLSVTDGHAGAAKAAIAKHIENLLGKT